MEIGEVRSIRTQIPAGARCLAACIIGAGLGMVLSWSLSWVLLDLGTSSAFAGMMGLLHVFFGLGLIAPTFWERVPLAPVFSARTAMAAASLLVGSLCILSHPALRMKVPVNFPWTAQQQVAADMILAVCFCVMVVWGSLVIVLIGLRTNVETWSDNVPTGKQVGSVVFGSIVMASFIGFTIGSTLTGGLPHRANSIRAAYAMLSETVNNCAVTGGIIGALTGLVIALIGIAEAAVDDPWRSHMQGALALVELGEA
mmetsp:Transcript_83061/g.221941  ORF Transcript_83061/g.221941 Transcript_83061/m.221941 type:complete len:256 (+) Transcript_83061:13-780(+)